MSRLDELWTKYDRENTCSCIDCAKNRDAARKAIVDEVERPWRVLAEVGAVLFHALGHPALYDDCDDATCVANRSLLTGDQS